MTPAKIPGMTQEAAKRARNNGRQPKRSLQFDQVQVQVIADVYEGKKKVDKLAVGPNGQPFVFFNLEDLREWANNFENQLAEFAAQMTMEASAKTE